MSSLYLSGMTPPRTTASSKATNALKASGASSPRRGNLARFFMSYITVSLSCGPSHAVLRVNCNREKRIGRPRGEQSTPSAPGCSPRRGGEPRSSWDAELGGGPPCRGALQVHPGGTEEAVSYTHLT